MKYRELRENSLNYETKSEVAGRIGLEALRTQSEADTPSPGDPLWGPGTQSPFFRAGRLPWRLVMVKISLPVEGLEAFARSPTGVLAIFQQLIRATCVFRCDLCYCGSNVWVLSFVFTTVCSLVSRSFSLKAKHSSDTRITSRGRDRGTWMVHWTRECGAGQVRGLARPPALRTPASVHRLAGWPLLRSLLTEQVPRMCF